MIRLYEQYRPKSWSEVLGQDKAIRQVQAIKRRGFGGKSFWISGRTGQGKTSIAYLIAAEIADKWAVEEIPDAGKLTPAMLQHLECAMHTYGLGKGGRAYIVNEAHGLRRDTIRQLLTLLERLPGHVTFIFCTTVEGQAQLFEEHIDASPLLSRCLPIALTSQGLSDAFAKRCKAIAQAEGLDGRPLSAYRRLAQDCHGNFRAMLQAVELGQMLAERR